jgi:hypothetical protein
VFGLIVSYVIASNTWECSCFSVVQNTHDAFSQHLQKQLQKYNWNAAVKIVGLLVVLPIHAH